MFKVLVTLFFSANDAYEAERWNYLYNTNDFDIVNLINMYECFSILILTPKFNK